jgi:hypothetical protein
LFARAVEDKAADRKQLGDDLIRARLELAAALEAGRMGYIPQVRTESAPAKADFFHDQMIAAFDGAISAATIIEDREAEALARYLKGAACVRLLGHYPRYEVKDGGIEYLPPGSERDGPMVKLPADRNPLAVFTEAVARSKDTKIAAETLMALGSLQQQLSLFVDAVRTYAAVIKDHPKSAYAGDARANTEAITFPRVSLPPTKAALPGEGFTIEASVRNVKEIAVAVSSFPLDAIYRSPAWLAGRRSRRPGSRRRRWQRRASRAATTGGTARSRSRSRSPRSRTAHTCSR